MKKEKASWYSISFTGGLMVSLYSLVPVYIVYADSLGLVTSFMRFTSVGGMLFVTVCVAAARKRGHQLFRRSEAGEEGNGFTLMELLVVISIIGILASILLPAFGNAKKAAYLARSKAEFKQISTALELYANAHEGSYPPDANRGLPSGLEAYLSGGNWPNAPWPGSVYDWDVWGPADLSYEPKNQIYQISVRFCPADQALPCQFPNEPWAQNFDYYSAVYYCVSGPCRAHSSQPADHAGYCVNC
ncbi:MAG TPA: type II secretion system protein [Candidatus Paceibacterota bacterium]|nr:type II secretion system protein [Candidatus Paceibacterota bacterium]